MKIMSWNCRGLQQAAAVRALLSVQKRRNPDVMFLMETHLDKYPVECLCRPIKMDHNISVRSDGRSSGLIHFWKNEIVVSLRDKADNYIDVFVGSCVENF